MYAFLTGHTSTSVTDHVTSEALRAVSNLFMLSLSVWSSEQPFHALSLCVERSGGGLGGG
jgi:hypothetical protein